MLILFLLSLFGLLYLVCIDNYIKINYPIIYQCLLVFFFLVLLLTSLGLLSFLFNFYHTLFFKIYYYLKDFLVKILSSGNNNASSSASQGSGENPNNNNNNNSNNSGFKNPDNKKPRKDTSSQPRTPKELRDSNKEVDNLNQSLRGYIKKLDELKKQHDIRYSLDSSGALSIDVPAAMSDDQAADLSRRVGVIDRLYNTQLETFKSVSSSALAKTEDFKKSSGSDPYTRNFLESQLIYNRFLKDTFNELFTKF